MKFFMSLVFLFAFFANACKTPQRADSSVKDSQDGRPPTTQETLDVAAVLKAMQKIRTHEAHVSNKQVVESCMANNTPHWSPIVSHMYCQIGQPRSCFTGFIRSQQPPIAGTNQAYINAFKHCLKDPSWAWIKADPEILNPLKYVMLTVYGPNATNPLTIASQPFTIESQDEAINKFYRVTNDTNCSKRYKSFTDFLRPNQRCGKFGATNSPDMAAAQKHLDSVVDLVNKGSKNCSWSGQAITSADTNGEYTYKISYLRTDNNTRDTFADWPGDKTASARSEADLWLTEYTDPSSLGSLGCEVKTKPTSTGATTTVTAAKQHLRESIDLVNKASANCKWISPKSVKLDPKNPGEYYYDVSVKNSTTGKRIDYNGFFGTIAMTPSATSKEWLAEYDTHLEDSKCAPIVSATQSTKLARAHVKDTLLELNKKVKNCEWHSPTLQSTDPKGEYEYSVKVKRLKTGDQIQYTGFYANFNVSVADEVKNYFVYWSDLKDSGCSKL